MSVCVDMLKLGQKLARDAGMYPRNLACEKTVNHASFNQSVFLRVCVLFETVGVIDY